MTELFATIWPLATATAVFATDAAATSHIVLHHRENRSALGWLGLVWFVPFGGAILYALFGINRIQRKARRLRRRALGGEPVDKFVPAQPSGATGVEALQRLVGSVTGRPLHPGSAVAPLTSGAEAYDAMLADIAAATRSVGLSTYIFDNDRVGTAVADALAEAVRRGVAVRVLIDDIGARYSFPSVVGRLRRAGVTVVRFLPSWLPWRFAYAQLRNHRKLLVVDGRIGFAGGMNIRDGHDARTSPRCPIDDCHFRFEGPVVADLRAAFADDWRFAAGETLAGAAWFPQLAPAGDVVARGIASGPDDDVRALRTVFHGAVACARRSVRIVTPYFVPDEDLVAALGVAALRGVEVDILLPECNNLRLVHWAMMGTIARVIDDGCRVWLTPAPFDHAKLFLVDDEWALVGSANWDARSLRLNFEFDVECHDPRFAGELAAFVERKRAAARRLTRAELDGRILPVRFRDGVARLASPYL